MSEGKLAKWQFELLFGLLAVLLVGLAAWVPILQHLDGPALAALAERQERRIIPLPGRPGDIYARTRRGQTLLAGSRQVPGVFADPKLLGADRFADVAQKVAGAVGADANAIYENLLAHKGKEYVWLAHDLTDEQAAAVARLKLRAVQVTHEWRRHYPNGALASQLVGFRRIDGEPGAGMELQADAKLRPTDGVRVLRCDAGRRDRYIEVEQEIPAKDGSHVLLTIDVAIQGYLESALSECAGKFEPKAIMGVVLNCKTGEILAISSWPTYDANEYWRATPDQLRLRSITDPYEPGSTFKPIIAVGSVEMGKATLESKFFCYHGMYASPKGGIIRDAPGERFGEIPLSEIVINSSNIGMAKLGELLGNPSLYRIATAFGYGVRSGVDIPGECPGRLMPVSRWTSYDTVRLPFGQGQIMVTALQLANGFATIANGGTLYKPYVIDQIRTPEGGIVYQGASQSIRRVISQAVAKRFVDEVLVNVVEQGTGKKALSDHWKIFGKTGTAQIGGPAGYADRAFTGSFVGGGPGSDPQIICVISVYHPNPAKGHFGGTVAAPYVKAVLEKSLSYLDVRPDKTVETQEDVAQR